MLFRSPQTESKTSECDGRQSPLAGTASRATDEVVVREVEAASELASSVCSSELGPPRSPLQLANKLETRLVVVSARVTDEVTVRAGSRPQTESKTSECDGRQSPLAETVARAIDEVVVREMEAASGLASAMHRWELDPPRSPLRLANKSETRFVVESARVTDEVTVRAGP